MTELERTDKMEEYTVDGIYEVGTLLYAPSWDDTGEVLAITVCKNGLRKAVIEWKKNGVKPMVMDYNTWKGAQVK